MNHIETIETIFNACELLDQYTTSSVLGSMHYIVASSLINQAIKLVPEGDHKTFDFRVELDEKLDALTENTKLDQGLSDRLYAIQGLITLRDAIATKATSVLGTDEEGDDSARDFKLTLESTLDFMASRGKPEKARFNKEWTDARRAKLPTLGMTRDAFVAARMAEEMKAFHKFNDAKHLVVFIVQRIDDSMQHEGTLPDWLDESITDKVLDKLHDAREKKAMRANNIRTKKRQRDEIMADILAIDSLIVELGGEVPSDFDEEPEFIESDLDNDDPNALVDVSTGKAYGTGKFRKAA